MYSMVWYRIVYWSILWYLRSSQTGGGRLLGKKDKKKNTFKKFGKTTSRGVRFAEEQKANTLNKKVKEAENQLSKKEKKKQKKKFLMLKEMLGTPI